MNQATRLFEALDRGDSSAAAQLLPLVYNELRALAASRMANEPAGHTLNATALVHEAYLRLLGSQHFDSRGHFFAAAAEAMRRILIDHARGKARLKRGANPLRVELIDQPASLPEDPDLLLSLDDLLKRLAAEDASAAEVAHLHLFGGLSVDEVGELRGMSRATVYRHWKYARAWLRSALSEAISE